ncbi:UDP-glucose/GDP-mannose dehydrogenase family protein [Bacillus sp. NEB1478]|uniref:UDP-glucose dehydrogenase family protein n=1 Tax=Bacillus sp. NEB1478 TaxID=3073816 RepID=UPI0028735153|nr:UDP-glucose/GDP-mannose dehydrogenase family protein [Bacillus sp. NEB1478]WNB92686.1 UDP-glucose/GDP-mannose dehydrogenase family protein [Bacillus sp. NEB1478]
MNISVVGTGYVGLVTGVCLSEVGHSVTCIDIDDDKVRKMRLGISPIYEPGLEELMIKNINEDRLHFTTNHQEGFGNSDIIYIAVGTPQKADGSADLRFIEQVAKDIAQNIERDAIVVTKSTVPVGTNAYIKEIIKKYLINAVEVDIVSNPEFLREGSAVKDTFEGDRIVIGAENDTAVEALVKVYEPFGIEIFKTDIHSAEMIKYASNAFLATKISFINEISNICEKVGANIEDVAKGMGQDKRIGSQFLNAGIGYGGSCFPKDTHALVQIAGNYEHEFDLLKSVITVNNKQQQLLVEKAVNRLKDLKGKQVALLGLAFKPNTDDMREAPSIVVSDSLIKMGATVLAYDPIATKNAKKELNSKVIYTDCIENALENADVAFILTEWDEIKNIDLSLFGKLMKTPIVFDGRNCFALENVMKHSVEYHSIGRPEILSPYVLV